MTITLALHCQQRKYMAKVNSDRKSRGQSMAELAVVVLPSHKGNSVAAGCSECPGLLRDVLFRSRAIDPLGQRAGESNVATRSGPGHKYSAGWDSRASKGTLFLGWHLLDSGPVHIRLRQW
jgi:hypothetical protein